MLSHEDNERLVRVGPGTPMGRLMRCYWLPFLAAGDVAADGTPHRVRLLGEDLVAFRTGSGRVGLIDHACPHRGAPLVLARNEAEGLRCIYHGWKFSPDGRCMDLPAEPRDSPMCAQMRIKAYPVRERNGVLWAWLGPDAGNPPALPALEWNLVPQERVVLSMRVQECNWLQALEGEIDSAHAAILHGRVGGDGAIDQWKQAQDLAPRFECVQHATGVHIAARRTLPDGQQYVRVNQFLMPFWTFVPPFNVFPELSGHAWVPIDDEHTLCVMFSYHPSRPMYEKTRKVFREGHQGRETAHPSDAVFEPRPVTHPYHRYWTKLNRSNAYGFDPALQRTFNAAMPGLWCQDAACQSGVAPICDRSRENLGTSDIGIVRTRRMLLDTIKRLDASGQPPASANAPEGYMVRAVSLTMPADADWKAEGARHMQARLGEDFGYTP
jgi:phenylpropionate dioxygenase-like ring-hydroxylating dioxygenase large terminal subunit